MIRRTRFITQPAFQLRYIGFILLPVLIVASICVLTTYYTAVSLLGEKLSYVYPQGRLVVILKEINSIMIHRVILLLPFIVFVALVLSHRIAGPAYRIEKTLREIGEGNFDIRVHLRKHDELKGIASAINNMLEGFKKMPNFKSGNNEAEAL